MNGDEYHSMTELYEHRHRLFLALMSQNKDMSWVSRIHEDGTMHEGWFIAGMHLPTGDVSYHLPNRMWPFIEQIGITEMPHAPPWDGYTPNDVLLRITQWAIGKDA